MTTAIIIPCFNEDGRLPVKTFGEFMAGHPDVRFIFVDDGSRDRTAGILQDLHTQHPRQAEVVSLQLNRGKAEAVRQGLIAAMKSKPDFTGYWDADLSTPLEAIADLQGILEERPDVEWVFGSRTQLLGRRIERRPLRHYSGRVFATLASGVLGIPVYDTQCGAKLFRCNETLNAVICDPFLTKWIFDVELIARLIKRAGGRGAVCQKIYEYPLRQWVHVGQSKVRLTDFLVAVWGLMMIYLRYNRNIRERPLE